MPKTKASLKKSLERLAIISDTASQLLISRTPHLIVEALCQRVMEHLDCHTFFNYLVDEERNCLTLNAYAGIPEKTARDIRFLDYGAAVCGRAALDACGIVEENIPTTPDPRTNLVSSFGIKAYACHPLFAQGHVIGTLSFGTRSRLTFAEDELSLMKTVADQVAIAIERMRLLQSAEARADELEQRVQERTTELRRQLQLLDLAHDAIILSDADGTIAFWSTGAKDTYGFSREEAIGNSVHRLLQTRFSVPLKDIMDMVERDGRWEGELTHTRRDGRQVIVHSRWARRQNEAGGSTQVMEVNRDITERKETEEALRLASTYNRNLIEVSLDPLVTIDPDGKITDANVATEKATGYSRRELIGTYFSDYFTEPEMARNGYRQVFSNGSVQDYPLEILHRDGHSTPVLYNAAVYRDETGKVIGVFAAARDITKRKQVESQLIKAREEWERTFDAIIDPIMIVDTKHMVIKANKAMNDRFGVSVSSGKGFTCFKAIHGSDEPPPFCPHSRLLTDGQPNLAEIYDERLGGHFLVSVSPLYDPDGRLFGSVHYARDITERKLAEEALRESEERYRVAIESASDGIALVREDQHAYVNARFAEIFGYENPGEIVGKPLSLTVHPDDLAMVTEINTMRQKGESAPLRYEFKGIKKDGTLRSIEVSAARTSYRGAPVSLAYLRDITEYRNLEDRVRQAQKMEAIGTLAGGIAHDFNNILAGVIGFTEMVLEGISPDDPAHRRLKLVLKGGHRGRDLVRQILTFSRRGEHEAKEVTVSSVIQEALNLLRPALPSTIDIRKKIIAVQDTVIADPVQLHQVLMNLCTNAAHAMRDRGGILEIGLTDTEISQQEALPYPDMNPGPYVRLSVSDTGHGMPPSVVEKIFDPFFTTKATGEGTGLGLSVVHGIVKSHGGHITVYSEPDKGTVFHIYLPRAVASATAETDASRPVQGGQERILFVDDEEMLVEMNCQRLQKLGYEMVPSTNSPEALEIFKRDPQKFDLVITDYTMPHMTGLELAQALVQIRPDIPVILCSGLNENFAGVQANRPGIKAFIPKTAGKQELAELIRKVLVEQPLRTNT
jgi:PAS domain S-box-containing protein